MPDTHDDSQTAGKAQRRRNILVGTVAALCMIFLGAWLAREFILPPKTSQMAQEKPDTGIINWQQVVAAHPDYEKFTALDAECQLLELEVSDVGDMLSLEMPQLLDETFKESVWQKNAADVIGGRAELERKAQQLRQEYTKATEADFNARRQALDEEYLNEILNLNIKLDNQAAMHNALDSKQAIQEEREVWEAQRSQLQAERGRRQYELWQAYKREVEKYVQDKLAPELAQWRASLPKLQDEKMAAAQQTKAAAEARNADMMSKQQAIAEKVQQRLAKRQQLAEKQAELAALHAHIINDVAGKAAKIAIMHHFTLILVHHPAALASFLPQTGKVPALQPQDSVVIGLKTQDVTDELVQEMKNI